MKNNLIAFAALILLSTSMQGQNRSIEFDHRSFSELLKSAKQENKLIYVDCFTTWCGPCKWMAKNIFTNDSVADFYNQNFINAKIDMEKGEGIELAKKYSIRNYPIMLYLDSDGNQLHRTCGSSDSQEFIQNGKNALDPNSRMESFTKSFQNNTKTALSASAYLDMLDKACMSKVTALDEYFESVSQENLSSKENWQIINRHVNDYFSTAFQKFQDEKERFSKIYTAEAVNAKLNEVYSAGLGTALRKKDMKSYESIKEKLRENKSVDAEKTILQAEISKSKKEEDWKSYANLVTEFIGSYAAEDAFELNNFAWAFYENIDDKNMLIRAEAWAKTSCELDDNYASNDTYASILFKLGKNSEAKIIAEKAIRLAKEKDEDAGETEALLKKINALQ